MKDKVLFFPTYALEAIQSFHLSYQEFLMVMYFWNFPDSTFDIIQISKEIKLAEEEIMQAFNSLLSKKILIMDVLKDGNGKRAEIVRLDPLYAKIDELCIEENKEQEKSDIYTIFEKEFGRPISSMEYEIIRAWLEKGFREELILGALKEAVYNGVNNLRYIDKILYEWQKKGFKTIEEVHNQIISKKETPKGLFDYNWLDDNE